MPNDFLSALTRRTDLNRYGNNSLLLYALEIGLNLDDIHTVAATALTDASNDKKCDLLYVDRGSGRVVIGQGYMARRHSRSEAPANKASDLNTAAAWVLGKNFLTLPEGLRAAAQELDAALEDDVIIAIEFWYCHNLPNSANVKRELDRVQATAESLLRRNYPQAHVETVSAIEVGRDQLDQWLRSIQVPIYVTDTFILEIPGGFETSGDRWKAFATSVPARWLWELFAKYKRQLFSANVRDYLGSRASDKNINNNIKLTAQERPRLFWAFNNGVTALVNEYEQINDSGGAPQLRITGLAIVNGAQTTGSIGSLDNEPDASAQVLARFVKCEDRQVLNDIIRYNNSQNKVEPSDFRSQDAVQERLRREFESRPLVYRGGRRGGEEDRIQRPRNLIPSDTAAQALASFHQEPNIAYNEKSRIWESDAVYARFFHDRTTAGHVLLCVSLVRAIEELKGERGAIPEDNRTETMKLGISFFRRRGCIWILCAAIGKCCEVFLDRAVADSFRLEFTDGMGLEDCVAAWEEVIRPSVPFLPYLVPSLDASLKRADVVREDVDRFRSLVEASRAANVSVYGAFAQTVQMCQG